MVHTIERVPVHVGPSSVEEKPPSPRRSVRKLLGWVAIAVGLVVAVVLVLLSITSDTAPERVETERAPADTSMVGVPQSADGAERYLAEHTSNWPIGVPQSADGAERYLAEHSSNWPIGVPQSADGAERYLAEHSSNQPIGVPGSADAAERYLAEQE